jgi:hypothetical protein
MTCNVKKYVCEEHVFEWLTKRHKLIWRGKKINQSYGMLLPTAAATKSSAVVVTSMTKGVARDRAVACVLESDIHSKKIITATHCPQRNMMI